MSEFTEKEREDGASCQKKLAPPRSLRDAGEKAETVWDMIAKRYPKAAPLLCEMETVIDRAENLLGRLRSVSYDNEIGRSNSTPISYSEELERQRSTSSVMGSSSTSEETNEVEEVGTGTSYDRIQKLEDPSVSTSSASVEEVEQKESTSASRLFVPSIDESANMEKFQTETRSGINESIDPLNSTSFDEKRNTVRTREVESLEGWDNVVGGKTMNSRRVNAKREASVGRQDRSGPCERSTTPRTTKSEVPREVESTRIDEGNVREAIDREIESVTTRKDPKTETVLSPKRRDKAASDSSPGGNASPSSENTSTRRETEKIKEQLKLRSAGGTNSPKSSIVGKTPVEILNDYASQNDKRVEFKILRNKPKSCEIECSFVGYNVQLVGSPESEVRNEVATAILRMLAENQIDEQDMKNLTPLSDNQMRDIVALGTGGSPENARRKLYKLCLERNAPKPIYSVKRRLESDGFKYSAECRALDNVGRGSGIREDNAKISAAEELYTKLRSEHCS